MRGLQGLAADIGEGQVEHYGLTVSMLVYDQDIPNRIGEIPDVLVIGQLDGLYTSPIV